MLEGDREMGQLVSGLKMSPYLNIHYSYNIIYYKEESGRNVDLIGEADRLVANHSRHLRTLRILN